MEDAPAPDDDDVKLGSKSSSSILFECDKRRLRQACADVQARLSFRCSPMK